MPKPDWLKIKNEYANSNISYRKLADKYSVAFQTLRDRAMRESWGSFREKQRNKIGTATAQKTADRISNKQADYTVDMAGLNSLAAQRARKWLADDNLSPRDLKSVTGALKDISDIAKGQPPKNEKSVEDALAALANMLQNPVPNREIPRNGEGIKDD